MTTRLHCTKHKPEDRFKYVLLLLLQVKFYTRNVKNISRSMPQLHNKCL